MTSELNNIIGRSINLYPQLYNQLKQQPFYSMAMNGMLKKSLQTAVENGVYVNSAYNALAELALQEEDYHAAIRYFVQTRPTVPYRDNSRYDLQLGGMYLRAEQFPEAEDSFLETLKTEDRERRLNEIWSQYKNRKKFSEFLSFCNKVDDKNITELLSILQAKCYMEMGRSELALSHLIRINSQKYEAESLYLQARVAESQKYWDTMELLSQRATVLEPSNSSYHLLFSRALQNQKKWPQAEQAASDAISYSERTNPWLYNHRAWIRWNRKDYRGAQLDWESAIEISPNTAWFYESLARVFEQGGNIDDAIRYLNKAIALRPDEQRFRKRHDELEKKQHH
jgi:tetratricopeptide (TPR) repeat protein